MGLKICHISDTHNVHEDVVIPECDLLIHSGDIGGRTNLFELTNFLIWFEKQPAKQKIFIAGNHDIVLDKKWSSSLKSQGKTIESMLAYQHHMDAMKLISNYNVKYLCDKEFVYQGLKIYGSPYTPSFHRLYWVFNADRGQEIKKVWSKIPTDTDILITHGPPHNILDWVDDKYREQIGEDLRVGCKDLLEVIQKRLINLKLCCFGHIHDNVGVVVKAVSNKRHVMFSNASVVTNEYKQLIKHPLIIEI